MKQMIRNWLGIQQIMEMENSILIVLSQIQDSIKDSKINIGIHNRALGRLIAKLDPMFAEDELSPERKAASDEITDRVIKKLVAEHLASNRIPQ